MLNNPARQHGVANTLFVSWRGGVVGELREPVPDMWYLDGEWVSNESPGARDFESLVRGFDAGQVYRDLAKGTRAILLETASPEESGVHAAIISLTGNRLFLRRIVDKDAVEWLVSTVK